MAMAEYSVGEIRTLRRLVERLQVADFKLGNPGYKGDADHAISSSVTERMLQTYLIGGVTISDMEKQVELTEDRASKAILKSCADYIGRQAQIEIWRG